MTDEMEAMAPRPQLIHITVLEIPVSYQAVLSTTPGLHARPPVLPRPNDPSMVMPPPPVNGYDFIFHIGVAGRGPLRIEKLAHRYGYRMKDADGQYAPVVHLPKDPRDLAEASEVERMEQFLGLVSSPSAHGPPGAEGASDVAEIPPNRGFGKRYENFPEEIHTEIDVAKLIHHLKETGIEVRLFPLEAAYLLLFIVQCNCSKCTRRWMLAITSVISSSTARLRRRSGCLHGRRNSKTEARRRKARPSCSCIVPRSASRSARER